MILTSYSGMARFGKCIGTKEAAAFTGYHSDIDRNSMTWMMNATWAEYNIVHANDPQWMRTWGFVMFCACIGIIIEFLGRIFKSWPDHGGVRNQQQDGVTFLKKRGDVFQPIEKRRIDAAEAINNSKPYFRSRFHANR